MNQVFAAITVNTTSGVFNNTAKDRTLIVLVTGTFGGGVLTIEISGDDGVSFAKMPNSLTAVGTVEETIPDEAQVRLVLSGAAGASLSAWTNLAIPSVP